MLKERRDDQSQDRNARRVARRPGWICSRPRRQLTRRSDELARRRQELPWVRIDKEYVFDTDDGTASLADLFSGRSQLLVYHFMFGPDYTAGCPACSAIADGFNGFAVHLANHDVMLWAVSRAPLAKLQAYKQRMGWSFPWASSYGSDFNPDFQVGYSEEQQQSGVGEYNFREFDLRSSERARHRGAIRRLGGHDRHGLGDLHAGVSRNERVRARRRRRLPHVLGLRARAGRSVGHVPVARPRTAEDATRHEPTTPRSTGSVATTSTTPTDACGRKRHRPHRATSG